MYSIGGTPKLLLAPMQEYHKQLQRKNGQHFPPFVTQNWWSIFKIKVTANFSRKNRFQSSKIASPQEFWDEVWLSPTVTGENSQHLPYVSHPILKINFEHQNDRKCPKDNFSYIKLQPLNFLGPSHAIPKNYGEKAASISPFFRHPKSMISKNKMTDIFPRRSRSQSKIAPNRKSQPLKHCETQHAMGKWPAFPPSLGTQDDNQS